MTELKDYRSKRRFDVSPEPEGGIGQSDPDRLRYVIQKHGATRLHYDLRLELDGVMKSWAITQGPSLDPSQRRLAVRTEDHPLDYAGFEGVIPPGEYGAGPMLVWDRGQWIPMESDPVASLEAGAMKFRLAGERLSGGFMLKKLPNDPKAWLLIKERDTAVSMADLGEAFPDSVQTGRTLEEIAADDARPVGIEAAMPKRLKPMLPSSVGVPPAGPEWLHEIKLDGYRTLAFVEDGAVRLMTRNGLNWTERYRALVAAFEGLDCRDAVIDGEIIVQDARGAASMDLLTEALSEGRDDALVFYAFDLVHLDGRDLKAVPLEIRKERLRRLMPRKERSPLQYSDHIDSDGKALFAEICRLGLEGVVSKKRDAPYREGRTTSWLKAKRYDLGRFAVIGFMTKAQKGHVASLLLAEESGGKLKFVGRAGSGLGTEQARALFEQLSPGSTDRAAIEVPKIENARFVEPGLVAEISYRGRTASGVLRQPAVVSVSEIAAKPARRKPVREGLVTDRDLASVRLTNPDRQMFGGPTKLDIALYYARVGDWMLPRLLDRPVTLIRCPSGKAKDCFYQRHAFNGLPDGIDVVEDANGEACLVIRTARGFLGLIQFGVVEFHAWDCRADDFRRPDRFTLDLDPGENVGWQKLSAAALSLKDRLEHLGLVPFIRGTGGKGLHLVVPLVRKQGWETVKAFLRALAKSAASDHPETFTTSPLKAQRGGRIFLDIGRTAHGSSAVASYSLRAQSALPVAMPLTWEAVTSNRTKPEFDHSAAVHQLEKTVEDPWEDMETSRKVISRAARRDVGMP